MTDQLVKGKGRGAEGDAANYNFLRQDLRQHVQMLQQQMQKNIQ
jgi:hypothetical protein